MGFSTQLGFFGDKQHLDEGFIRIQSAAFCACNAAISAWSPVTTAAWILAGARNSVPQMYDSRRCRWRGM